MIRSRITNKVLEAFPSAYVRKIPGGPFKKGLPDMFMVILQVPYVIEGKVEGKSKVTRLQRNDLDEAYRAGAQVAVAVFRKDGTLTLVNWGYGGEYDGIKHTLAPIIGAEVMALKRCTINLFE